MTDRGEDRSTRYVALLRGINVGGKNLIRMPALKACFEELGFVDVGTYIQSGNVLFTTGGKHADLVRRIEAALSKTFGYTAHVVLRSRLQLRSVVDRAPAGFGVHPALYRYDVLFVKEPLTVAAVLPRVPVKEGVDEVSAGPGVLYFSRRSDKAAQSYLSRFSGRPEYKRVTVRNWNTTTKLAELLDVPANSRRR